MRTLADVYGEARAQRVQDVEWIALATDNGLVVLCKDDHIRRRPAEREALLQGNVKAFCLTNAELTFDEQASCFVENRFRIIQACRKPGPFVYGVHSDRIVRLWPNDG